MTLCDFCKDYGHEVAAEYDGRTVFGSCAYMCIRHFEKFGTGIGHARQPDSQKVETEATFFFLYASIAAIVEHCCTSDGTLIYRMYAMAQNCDGPMLHSLRKFATHMKQAFVASFAMSAIAIILAFYFHI